MHTKMDPTVSLVVPGGHQLELVAHNNLTLPCVCVCVCVCGKDASVDSSEADGSVRSALHGGPLK